MQHSVQASQNTGLSSLSPGSLPSQRQDGHEKTIFVTADAYRPGNKGKDNFNCSRRHEPIR